MTLMKFKIIGYPTQDDTKNDWTVEAKKMVQDEKTGNILFYASTDIGYGTGEIIAIVSRGAFQFIKKVD